MMKRSSLRVSLSFDNGPEPGVTEGVLDTLRARRVAASFFVIGAKVARPGGRALVERARAEGHRVGNHTYTHSVPLGQDTPDAVEREIEATRLALGPGGDGRLFRPYGVQGRIGPHLLSAAARAHLIANGYTCVLWNALPRDWLDPEGWVETAMAQCAALPHALLTLHDLPTGAMRRLPELLDRLADAGAEIVQDYPADCLPIRDGVPQPGCDAYVTA